MKDTFKIAAVICTYNRSELLRHALTSLMDQSLDIEAFEVIVVDNASRDDTRAVVQTFIDQHPGRHVRYFYEEKQGLSHARNAGYRNASSTYIAYLDDDAKADRDWLKRIVEAFETVTPSPDAVGGKIVPYYLSPKPEWFLDEFEVHTWGEVKGFLKIPEQKAGFHGSNMTFPKALLEEYRGFSSVFGMTGKKIRAGEETDLFYRMAPKYSRFWYDPDIKVEHLASARNMTLRQRIKGAYAYSFSMAQVKKMHGEKATGKQWLGFLRYMIGDSVWLVLKMLRPGKYWQRVVLKYGGAAAVSAGKLMGFLLPV